MTSERKDEDPTDIRRLLSGMSDPHPMSDDLVSRISASLEEERRHRRDDDLCRFDPALGRPRRSVLPRRLAMVAVVTVVATVAVVATIVPGVASVVARQAEAGLGLARAELAAVEPTATVTDGAAAPLGVVAPSPAAPGGRTPSAQAGAPAAGLTIISSGTDYRRGHLTEQAQTLMGSSTGGADATKTALPRGTSRESIENCLRELSLLGSTATVDVATYNGRSALILVGGPVEGSTTRTLAVVPDTCGRKSTDPLAGPYRFR
ncbi:hypothetical protein [Mobilicoccus caccae]|uniref:Uncharacterized protein n=1 Tax=Mobilicoccus caccae TaxID=1859295 RepID=A0ABQ6IXF4_9MICO|nr:hypothetical protein [Mobilicoccus caccae]GMA41822.1 hypothetical protein GCM10025883_38670 [Mobilicoccus caccae]